MSMLCLLLALSADPVPDRPNLVLFLSDDHGYLDAGCYGGDAKTPNMDRIAAAGARMTGAFVATPSCGPCRASLMSGLYPARNGAQPNHSTMRADLTTLPTLLDRLGYRVAHFGKSHFRPKAALTGMEFVLSEDKHGKLDVDLQPEAVDDWLTAKDAAGDDRPVCLIVCAHSPHVYWPANHGYDADAVDLPPTFIDTPETRDYRTRYLTDVTRMDERLGRVYDVARQRLGDNTLFVYTSDHGAQWPFGKWNLYDAGIRVPMLASWPGKLKPGTTLNALVSFVDLLPTFVELAGGTPPPDIDGRSFAAVLRGTRDTHRTHVFASHSGDGDMNVYPMRAVRNGRYKYVRNLHPEFRYTTHIDQGNNADGLAVWRSWERAAGSDPEAAEIVRRYHERPAEELYDVLADPHEQHNLAGDPAEADTLVGMRTQVTQWMTATGDPGQVFGTPRLLSEPEQPPAAQKPDDGKPPWAYTTAKPADDWTEPNFDDSGWKRGRATFGTEGTPGADVRTTWDTPDIWLRREVTLPSDPKSLALRILHDEDTEVYLNGTRIAQFRGYIGAFRVVKVGEKATAAATEGPNTLAVHCHQTGGGQSIDVTLLHGAAAAKAIDEVTPKLQSKFAADLDPDSPLPEYPRPQMVRDDDSWSNLNGHWDYAITGHDSAMPTKWADEKIVVPFCIESQLSGVRKSVAADQDLWYRRSFTAPTPATAGKNGRTLLHFGAVDWRATVYVNGEEVGSHEGGYDPFSFDLTGFLKDGTNELAVKVWDPTTEGTQPVGKQRENPGGIWYTPVTGIWQTVWLEAVPAVAVSGVKLVPDAKKGAVTITVSATEGEPDARAGVTAGVRLVARRKGDEKTAIEGQGRGKDVMRPARLDQPFTLAIPDCKLWSPAEPWLYDLEVVLIGEDGVEIDRVTTYAGIRDIALMKDAAGIDRIALNGQPLFQFGPLDQGWWPGGLYTAPTDEALAYDVEMTRKLGFNCARKHVKVEPARWYHHCDRLGLLVWQDMPTMEGFGAGPRGPEAQAPDSETATRFRSEWQRIIDALHDVPSIVIWVPFNEGWGQHDTDATIRWTQQYDPTRLVDGPSGWFDTGTGDMLDAHRYPGPGMPAVTAGRAAVLGEFGGVAWAVPDHLWLPGGNWGYRQTGSREEFVKDYSARIKALRPLIDRGLAAAIYTQTTDVETEVNGLLTYDREVVKIDPALARQLAEPLYQPAEPADGVVLTNRRARWLATAEKPSGLWRSLGYDDSAWTPTMLPVGDPAGSGYRVQTPWTDGDMWLRQRFHIPAATPAGRLLVVSHVNGGAEVFLNGRKLPGEVTGFSSMERQTLLPHGFTEALRVGDNVLAVRAAGRDGRQRPVFDLSLSLMPADD